MRIQQISAKLAKSAQNQRVRIPLMTRNQIAIDVPCIAKVEIRRLIVPHFRTLLLRQAKRMSFGNTQRSQMSRRTQATGQWRSLVNADRHNVEVPA